MLERLGRILPRAVKDRLEAYEEALSVLREMHDPRVMSSIGPSAVRGLLLQRGKQGHPTKVRATHEAHFDWTYPDDHPQMRELYGRAKRGQWDADDLPWHTDVDPLNPEVPLLPHGFIDAGRLRAHGIRLDAKEEMRLSSSLASWMLSQFLHGEQGALFASAQVTEAVQFFDGKLYGSTQVVDEARHVEVFHRYLDTKLEKLYQINDNLFVIIDALMTDSRWDMKFLGMQIMVEGLALGAFGMIRMNTPDPLLRDLTAYVMGDEARHVAYGVLSLRDYYRDQPEAMVREREDFVYEAARLMRDRFLFQEVWEKVGLPVQPCMDIALHNQGQVMFRQLLFAKIVPAIKKMELLSDRQRVRFAELGILQFESAPDPFAELEREEAAATRRASA